MAELLRWSVPEDDERPPLIREPWRVAGLVGAVLTFIGTLLPWATGVDARGAAVSFSPFSTADGVLFVMLSAAVPVLVLSRSVADSRTRSLQASNLVVGVVAALNWLAAVRAGVPPIVGEGRVAWTNEHEPGLFVTAAGVALLLAAGTRIAVRAWRENGTLRDPLDVPLTRASVVSGFAQALLGVTGFVVALSVPVALFGPYAILVMTLASIGAGGLGIVAGKRISSLATRRRAATSGPRRPRTWTDAPLRF